MTELPPDAKALLARARSEQPKTNAAMRARVRVAVEHAVALSIVPAAEHAQHDPAAGRPGVQLALGKLASAAAGVVAVACVVWLSRSVPIKPASQARTPPMQTTVTTTPDVAATHELAAPPAGEQSTSEHAAHALFPVQYESLASELRVVRRADHALRAGRAHAAMSMLAAYQARFPGGQLTNEREGLSLIAACSLDRPGAPARARLYLQGRPSSLVHARITAACNLSVGADDAATESGVRP